MNYLPLDLSEITLASMVMASARLALSIRSFALLQDTTFRPVRFLMSSRMPCILALIQASGYPFALYVARARAIAFCGSISSSIRSVPTLASHLFRGSAFGDGIVLTMRRICWRFAASVNRNFPLTDDIFNRTISSYVSADPSFYSFLLAGSAFGDGMG